MQYAVTQIQRERRLKYLRIAMIVVGILLAGTVFAAARDYANSKNAQENEIAGAQKQAPKKVATMVIGEENNPQEFVHASGEARPATSVDVSAKIAGTVSAVYFGIGDRVNAGDALIALSEGSVSASYQNAQTAARNAEQSLAAVRSFSDESISAAEINVQNAEESLRGAEIALDSSRSNLKNSQAVIQKANKDALENAILSYENNIASTKYWLDQINYIIGAEDGRRLEEIRPTLSVRDSQALTDSRREYHDAKNAYHEFLSIRPTSDSITRDMLNIVFLLELAKSAASAAIEVLDSSIPNTQFSDASLGAQKASFAALKSSIIAGQANALSLQQSLQNISLTEQQQIDALENAASQAQSRMNQSIIALASARASLASARANKTQQIAVSQSQLDASKGQLNLVSESIANLLVDSPIEGTITARSAERGAKVSPGQVLATVARTDLITIEVSLAPADAGRIDPEQRVLINGEHHGYVSRVNPSADAATRKVAVEIVFDNESRVLTPNTFVDVSIPVFVAAPSTQGAFLIPLSAVTAAQTGSFVFVIEGNSAIRTHVTTGTVHGALIEITSGLSHGNRVAISGNKRLEDKDAVIESE